MKMSLIINSGANVELGSRSLCSCCRLGCSQMKEVESTLFALLEVAVASDATIPGRAE